MKKTVCHVLLFLPALPLLLPAQLTDSGAAKTDAEVWKDKYFQTHPDADLNQDGEFTWWEYNQHKQKANPAPAKPASTEAEGKTEQELANERWKNQYFSQHPEADLDGDGALSWYEYHQHKGKAEVAVAPTPTPKPATPSEPTEEEKAANERWKNEYFRKFPEADADGDGTLTWWELQQHKKGAN